MTNKPICTIVTLRINMRNKKKKSFDDLQTLRRQAFKARGTEYVEHNLIKK